MFSDDWFTDSTSLGAYVALLDENPDVLLAFSGSRQVMLDGQDISAMHHVTAAHQKILLTVPRRRGLSSVWAATTEISFSATRSRAECRDLPQGQ